MTAAQLDDLTTRLDGVSSWLDNIDADGGSAGKRAIEVASAEVTAIADELRALGGGVGMVLVPAKATREWAEAYCARVNRHPDGGQMSVCEGQWREISFRDLAMGEINCMIHAAHASGGEGKQ